MSEQHKPLKFNVSIPVYHAEALNVMKANNPSMNISKEFLNALVKWKTKGGKYENIPIQTKASSMYMQQYIYVPSNMVDFFNNTREEIKRMPRRDGSKIKLGDVIMTILRAEYGV